MTQTQPWIYLFTYLYIIIILLLFVYMYLLLLAVPRHTVALDVLQSKNAVAIISYFYSL